MLTITRNLARRLRAVFRRAGIKASGYNQRLSLLADADGLRIRAVGADVAVEYHLPSALPAEQISLPLDFLEVCQGRDDDPVSLESRPDDKVLASWTDGGLPQMREFDSKAPAGGRAFPEPPTEFTPISPELWQALRDAREATDPLSSRFALGCIQLRGATGQLVATDGRQLFAHDGFQFPWTDELLIPGLALLGCSELAGEADLAIAKKSDRLAFRLGSWTLMVAIQTEGRFPRTDDTLSAARNGKTHLILVAQDAQFLAAAFPKLPYDMPECDGVTLDLNGQLLVRAKPAGDTPPTELVLSRSSVSGEAVTLSTSRSFLARALKLGCTEFTLNGEQPAYCRVGHKEYLWAVLSKEGIVPADPKAIRIEPPVDAVGRPITKPRRRITSTMSQTNSPSEGNGTAAEDKTPATVHAESNGHPATNGHAGAKPPARRAGGRKSGSKGVQTPIEQAVALKASLRETLAATSELIRTLKRQKKQSRLVASTLQSLKQLQAAG